MAETFLEVRPSNLLAIALYQSVGFVLDPNAKIQTGPGLPDWQWHKVLLSWNGSVDLSSNGFRFYLRAAF